MGLLEQVIGQVIGNMAGGLAGGRTQPQPTQQTGRPPAGPGGGLGDLLGGLGGKYSPLVMALLALLASKHLNTGAGGYGSVIGDILGKLGGGGGLPGGGTKPDMPAGHGGWSLPEPSSGDKPEPRRRGGGDGGFLDSVGSMLDGPGSRGGAPSGQRSDAGGGSGDSGFDDLFERFRRNGQSHLMDSWVGTGPNQRAAPHELEQALGSGTIDDLSRQTGLGRDELLAQLGEALPQVIDGLTPGGRTPTSEDQSRWI